MVEVTKSFFTLARIMLDVQPQTSAAIAPASILGSIVLGTIAFVGVLTATIIVYDSIHAINSHVPPIDMVVRMTYTLNVWVYELDNYDFGDRLPLGINSLPMYRSIPGWEFLGWQRAGNNFVAQYEKPQIAVRYFGSNNAYITTRYIDFTLTPVTEMQRTGWWNRIREAMRETFINWSFFGALESIQSASAMNNLIDGMVIMHTVDVFEIFFLMANPDLHLQEGWGVFGASGASVRSPFFRFGGGTPANNDYVMWANFDSAQIVTPRWEITVMFDTPWDRGANMFRGFITWITGGGWWTFVFIVIFLTVGIAVLQRVARGIRNI